MKPLQRTEAERIAGSLTKAQREAIGWFEPDVLYDYHRLNGRVRVALFFKGLIASTHAADLVFMSLTSIGEAVRTHLLSQDQTDER